MKDPTKINVLVACEESQRVCMAFRDRGFNAFSCDIQECSGGHPEYHILGDAVKALDAGNAADIFRIFRLLLTKEECKYGIVKGWLTAEDVFARIKKHWEENYGRG